MRHNAGHRQFDQFAVRIAGRARVAFIGGERHYVPFKAQPIEQVARQPVAFCQLIVLIDDTAIYKPKVGRSGHSTASPIYKAKYGIKYLRTKLLYEAFIFVTLAHPDDDFE